MTKRIATRQQDGIATIAIGPFTSAAISDVALTGLAQALTRLDGAKALILSLGPLWPELEAAPSTSADDSLTLQALTQQIEALDIPVVAALSGPIIGAGFDLALAAHYRVATPSVRLGFSEVAAGGLPRGGGTQRLPRLVGADRALDFLVSGRIMGAQAALALGLLDDVTTGDLERASQIFARGLLSEGIGVRRTSTRRDGFADPSEFQSAISDRRATLATRHNPAMERALSCVEAALLLPISSGFALEDSHNEDLALDPTARAIGHIARAEQYASAVAEAEAAQSRPLSAIGLLGAGTMGASIAAAVLETGLPVVLVERDHEAMNDAVKRVHGIFTRAVERGRMSEEDAVQRAQMLVPTSAMEPLSDVDLVIEAVNEPLERKAAVLSTAQSVLRPDTPMVVTSATADLEALAGRIDGADTLLGLHFTPPAHMVRAVEIAKPSNASAQATATVYSLARRLGKFPVRAGAAPGRISGILLAALVHAADDMIARGAAPSDIDAAMRQWGMRMGPYQMLDLAGLDTPLVRFIRRPETRGEDESALASAELVWEAMLARGLTGGAKGAGYLRANDLVDNPDMLAVLSEVRVQAGIAQRSFDTSEIQRRCMSALVNTGARLVQDGAAQRPSDIDVIAVHALGIPRWRGGPMITADLVGHLKVQKDLLAFAGEAPTLYQPVSLLNDLVKNGQNFADLNTMIP